MKLKYKLKTKVIEKLGAPKRVIDDIKLKSFLAGYSTIENSYKKMNKKAVFAATELRLGMVSDDSRRFLKSLLGKFKKNPSEEDARVKEMVKKVIWHWDHDDALAEDREWIEKELLPYLDECKKRDARDLQKMLGIKDLF